MHVRKFYGETLDEVLKKIKVEFGPDAIILKTETNSGLKGAFKKNKIEITAAISEKSYIKKANVDHVLPDEKRSEFYQADSSHIASMIDSYSGNRSKVSVSGSGYGSIGLNKVVKQEKNTGNPLDEFLNPASGLETSDRSSSISGLNEFISSDRSHQNQSYHFEKEDHLSRNNEQRDHRSIRSEEKEIPSYIENLVDRPNTKNDRKDQSHGSHHINTIQDLGQEKLVERIDELEKKIFQMTEIFNEYKKENPEGLKQVRNMLRSFDISDDFTNKVIMELTSQFSTEDLGNSELVFEYMLQKMAEVVVCKQARFSEESNKDQKTITVLISETSSGQSTTMIKLGTLVKDSTLIQYVCEKELILARKFFDVSTVRVSSVPEIVSETRKSLEAGKNTFIDFKVLNKDVNEAKKFIDGLHRSFENIEVLVHLSAIHSEIYNRKVLNLYGPLADGIILGHLDLCLNYGNLFNLYPYYERLPLKFYTTGKVVPDDIEAASTERILAGIFQLN